MRLVRPQLQWPSKKPCFFKAKKSDSMPHSQYLGFQVKSQVFMWCKSCNIVNLGRRGSAITDICVQDIYNLSGLNLFSILVRAGFLSMIMS